MIASGESILEVAVEMKKKQARKIYLVASFALFTNGIEVFDKAYEKKIFDGIYTTNLTYIPEKYQTRKWLTSVDCMPYLADIIYTLGCGESIQELLNGKRKVLELMYHKKGIN